MQYDYPGCWNPSTIIIMGLFQALSIASIACAFSAQAAVSTTGFTVSLEGIDYFLPPKPVASINGCEEIEASFENGPFVPITVVKNGTVDIAAHSKDDVWQPAFLEGTWSQDWYSSGWSNEHQQYLSKAAPQSTPRTPFLVEQPPAQSTQDPTSSMLPAKYMRRGDYSQTDKGPSRNQSPPMATAHTPFFQPEPSDRISLLPCLLDSTTPKLPRSL
jgi:hypothetical protein